MEHRTQIYLGDEHYRFLKEKAEREGVSLAKAVRSLIEREMPTNESWERDPIWSVGQSGFRSGVKDGSRRRHEVFRESLKKRHRREK